MHADRASRRRILVIDDNEAIHADFRKILAPALPSSNLAGAKAALFGGEPGAAPPSLRPKFEVDCVSGGEEGVRCVAAARELCAPYHVAFVDMRMPGGWDGLTTIRHLWEADPQVQVVICSAYSDHSFEEISTTLGQSDRLLILRKPFDNIEIVQLATTLSEKWLAQREAALKMEELERRVQERTAEIMHVMLHDKLTGLPNRTLLQTRLEACIQRRARHPEDRFAILFLDFDGFKTINDSLGHEVGDVLLIEIANRLRSAVRESDLICRAGVAARLGGDEFVVLLEELQEERDAARVAERLLEVVAEPYLIGDNRLYLTASIGIATSDRAYSDAVDMIRDADTAMYRAKAAGRACYVMFDRRMHEEVARRLATETQLRKAIAQDSLTLHYQPIVRLAEGEICGFEALLRWNPAEGDPLPAGEVISIAEDTGLIHPLSLSTLRAACRQLREWQSRWSGRRPLLMSVNLSRKVLRDRELVAKIAATMQEAGIDPGTLILEITESTLLSDRVEAERTLEQLRGLGIWLHLDDFGTGYSSLGCLFELPLNGLKIDRSFIRRICRRNEYSVVLDAIVRIARAFGLEVVAEGVENTEEAEQMRKLGIDYAQGYLFGQPMPAAEAAVYIDEPVALSAPA